MADLNGSETIGIVIVVSVLAIGVIVVCFRCARSIVEEMQRSPPGQRSFKKAFRSSVRRTARQGVQHVNTIRQSFRRSRSKLKENSDAPPSYNEVLNSSANSQSVKNEPIKNADIIAPQGRRQPKGQQPSTSFSPSSGNTHNKRSWIPSLSAASSGAELGLYQNSFQQDRSPEFDNSRNLQLSELAVSRSPSDMNNPNVHMNSPSRNICQNPNINQLSGEYEPLRNHGIPDYEKYKIPNSRYDSEVNDPRSPGFIRTPAATDPRSPAGVPRTPAFRYEEGDEIGFRPYVPPSRHTNASDANYNHESRERRIDQQSSRNYIPTVTYHPSSPRTSNYPLSTGQVSIELHNDLTNQPDTYI